MGEQLKPLEEWLDQAEVCVALEFIREGADPLDEMVKTVVALAERLRYAEDYMLIHKLQCPKNN